LPALSHVARLLFSLSLFTSQLIIVFFVLRGVVAAAAAAAVGVAVDAAVALAALLLPLRSRPAALAAASKTGDIAMALACSDLGQKAITFSAIQDAAGQDVAAAAADDDYVAVASGPGTQKKKQRVEEKARENLVHANVNWVTAIIFEGVPDCSNYG